MIANKVFHRTFLLGLLLTSPLLVAAEGGGCAPSDDVPIGSDDGGAGVPCGPNTCAKGEECCNESCGICTQPGGACIQLACGGGAGQGGGTGVSCGNNVCGAGEYCCNESCGICAKPDEGCVTMECKDPCDAQNAAGVGACDMFLGYAWDGKSCTGLSGCSCQGPDCSALYPTLDACNKTYTECGNTSGTPCGPVTCGTGLECCNESCGICTQPGGACIQIACEPACKAQDAKGEGACLAFFGYAWNGSTCEGLSGCSCVGKDCSNTYDTQEACMKDHAQCP
ncbi:MAG: hypothetical protein R3B13_29600 [Polyangiaceae bacterium]